MTREGFINFFWKFCLKKRMRIVLSSPKRIDTFLSMNHCHTDENIFKFLSILILVEITSAVRIQNAASF